MVCYRSISKDNWASGERMSRQALNRRMRKSGDVRMVGDGGDGAFCFRKGGERGDDGGKRSRRSRNIVYAAHIRPRVRSPSALGARYIVNLVVTVSS